MSVPRLQFFTILDLKKSLWAIPSPLWITHRTLSPRPRMALTILIGRTALLELLILLSVTRRHQARLEGAPDGSLLSICFADSLQGGRLDSFS